MVERKGKRWPRTRKQKADLRAKGYLNSSRALSHCPESSVGNDEQSNSKGFDKLSVCLTIVVHSLTATSQSSLQGIGVTFVPGHGGTKRWHTTWKSSGGHPTSLIVANANSVPHST